jgi:FKBP-type peptidyl-prolyl cis-trans isomerase SlyD
MRVAKDRVVAIDYTIRDVDGNVVESTDGAKPFVYLHGHEQIVPGIEVALDGHAAGESLDVSLAPDEAYGDHDPKAIVLLPRRAFPPGQEPEVGDLYRASRADGKPVIFSILDVSDQTVVIDANHPLAGQTLSVHVEVIAVRTATDDERRHEHVHETMVAGTELA